LEKENHPLQSGSPLLGANTRKIIVGWLTAVDVDKPSARIGPTSVLGPVPTMEHLRKYLRSGAAVLNKRTTTTTAKILSPVRPMSGPNSSLKSRPHFRWEQTPVPPSHRRVFYKDSEMEGECQI